MAVAEQAMVVIDEREVMSAMSHHDWLNEDQIVERIMQRYRDPEFPEFAPTLVGRPLAFLERLVDRGQAESRLNPELASRRLVAINSLVHAKEYRLLTLPSVMRSLPHVTARPTPVLQVSAAPHDAGPFLWAVRY